MPRRLETAEPARKEINFGRLLGRPCARTRVGRPQMGTVTTVHRPHTHESRHTLQAGEASAPRARTLLRLSSFMLSPGGVERLYDCAVS